MELVNSIIIVLITVLIAGSFAFIVDRVRRKNDVQVSFKESLDLCDLPVITFYNNGKKINFLLDTGANLSVIDSNILDQFDYKEYDVMGVVYGIEGNIQNIKYVTMDILYKNMNFNEQFQVMDMGAAFGNVKSESGVTLHGILGNNFFKKYKYILDFDILAAIIKK